MIRLGPPLMLSVATILTLAACAAPASAPSGVPGRPESAPTAPQRTLAIIIRGEPPSLAAKPIVAFSGALNRPSALFNATLDYRDEREAPQAYLAEALPQLNTDTWRVFPDGRMETTYRLKPNLTWHDGELLTAEDFVFAWRVYSTPDFGVAKSPPIVYMEEVVAQDPRTVVIRWRQPYPDAGVTEGGTDSGAGFQALPQHILGEPFRELDSKAFGGLPFWTSEYVGLGPYKVTGWEPGASIDGAAFAGYVFGRPKIDHIRVAIISDPQTAVANILAGEVHFIADPVLAVADGEVLEQQWAENRGGVVLYSPIALRSSLFQFRPEVVESPALLDVRVRMAIAHAIDRSTAVEVLTAGKGIPTDTLTSPRVDYYREIEPVIQKYPYDPRRTQQLMEEAGFTKAADGFFVGSDGQPLRFSLASSSGTKNETESATYVDGLRRAGIDASQRVVSAADIKDPKNRALLPGIQVRGGGNELRRYTSEQIPRLENRWHGDNRGGWSNPEYDRLNALALITLDQSERVKLVVEMERVLTHEVPLIPNFFGVYTTPYVAALEGPVARQTPDSGGPFLHVYKWELRS